VASVRIEVSDLWSGEYDERLPVAAIDADENSHIHGTLTIVIAGRELPYLGYFGPDDVCLNTWIEELLQIRARLRAADGEYVFDEGEQGQPAFAFERSGKQVLVSVLPSLIGGGRGDESWTKVACDADEFFAAIDRVLDQIREQVIALGAQGQHWWRSVSRSA
jgi:hypothetical protein